MPPTGGRPAPPFTSETGRVAAKRKAALVREARLLGPDESDDAPRILSSEEELDRIYQDNPYGTRGSKRISEAEWARLYTYRAFPGRWADYYRFVLKRLRQQYAPAAGGAMTQQYEVLVSRVAALQTLVHFMEAEKADPLLLLKRDAQLKSYVSQLQKYTEAQKIQLQIQNEVMLDFAQKVIAVAEATIETLGERSRFMRALQGLVTGEGDRALLPAPLVIDGESRSLDEPLREISSAPGDNQEE